MRHVEDFPNKVFSYLCKDDKDFSFAVFEDDIPGGILLSCSSCGRTKELHNNETVRGPVECDCGKEIIYSGRGDW